MRSPYEVLGVEKNASAQDISSAYRRKALLHHPDRNPGDESAKAIFIEATKAYEILSDDGKRLALDMAESAASRPRRPGFSVGFDIHGMPVGGFDFDGGFGFDNRNPVDRARRSGRDVEHEIALTVEESVLGATKVLSFNDGAEVQCTRCAGTTAEPGTRRIPCTHCAGSGRSFFGGHERRGQACRQCGGRGDTPVKRCIACEGSGSTRSTREFSVKFPAGISDGQRLRMAGKGEPGDGGPPGDMFVTVRVREGGRFTRHGNDLHLVARVPFYTAMGHLGATKPAFHVTGIDGRQHRIDLSQEFRPGNTVFVVRGAGVGGMSGERGNMHVVLHVDLPEVRTTRASALARELVDELTPLSERWSPPSPDD